MDIKTLKRDVKYSEAGDWVGEIPEWGEIRLKVRGLKNTIVSALMKQKERKVPASERDRFGELKPAAQMRVFGEVLAEAVLFDWDGFTNDGEPVPFDADLAREWLTDNNNDFKDAVAHAAGVIDREAKRRGQDIAGN